MIDTVYRNCGQKETVIFCDRIMALGFQRGVQGRHFLRQGRHGRAGDQGQRIIAETRALAKEYEQQYQRRPHHPGREIQQGRRRLVEMHRQARRGDDEAHLGRAQGRQRPRLPINSIYMMAAFRRARFADADEAARRHARPDGQALGRDHREPDHLELQGRPDRSRILQLDPRRPQGPRRYGAEDRELRLSDPPSGRRGAGFDHHLIRLRLDATAFACARSSTRGQVVASLAIAHSRPFRRRGSARAGRHGHRARPAR